MITELRVHNFRTFINATFRFKQRHVLIGKNTSGKTNLGLALTFPRVVTTLPLTDAIMTNPGGYLDFCNYAIADKDRNTTFSLRAEVDSDGGTLVFAYDFCIWSADPRRVLAPTPPASILRESLTVTGGSFKDTPLMTNDGKRIRLLQEDKFREGVTDAYTEAQAPGDSTMLAKLYESSSSHTAVLFRNSLRSVAYFSLSPDRMRIGWAESRSSKGLESNGANLAQMIYQLKTRQEGRYRRVLDRVRRIEPRLEAINFDPPAGQIAVPRVALRDNHDGTWASLSDGTLLALGLSYLFECANLPSGSTGLSPPVYVIEEPENSMFVGELHSLLYDAENVAPLGQMIFTTHSPYFMEQFDNDLDAVTLLQRKEWHTTSISLGERRAEIEEALKTMSLGEQYFRDMLG